MDIRKLEHILTSFQASARGYLLRKEVQRARQDFEAVVREIDGGLTHLRWKKSVIPVPHFTDTDDLLIPTSRVVRKPPNSGRDDSASLRSPLERSPPTGSGDNLAHRTEAERDDSRTKIPLIPKETHTTCSITEELEGQKETSVKYKDCRLIDSAGDSTNVWSSLEQDMNYGHSQKGSQLYCSVQDVPRNPEALRLHRNTLTMELLWLQQAIDSRKKYLSLKNRLSVS